MLRQRRQVCEAGTRLNLWRTGYALASPASPAASDPRYQARQSWRGAPGKARRAPTWLPLRALSLGAQEGQVTTQEPERALASHPLLGSLCRLCPRPESHGL